MSKRDQQSEARRIAEAKKRGRDMILESYGDIVQKLVGQAQEGSVPHAKLCLELLETRAGKGADEEDDEDYTNLAEYLIEQLQLTPPPSDDAPPGETV